MIDVLADDEAAAVATREALSRRSSRAPVAEWECADQELLRGAVPEDPKRIHDARALLGLLADSGSVLELRAGLRAHDRHRAGADRGPARSA